VRKTRRLIDIRQKGRREKRNKVTEDEQQTRSDATKLIKGNVSDTSIDFRGLDELTEFRNPFPLSPFVHFSLSFG
jgi:hypothetical protein